MTSYKQQKLHQREIAEGKLKLTRRITTYTREQARERRYEEKSKIRRRKVEEIQPARTTTFTCAERCVWLLSAFQHRACFENVWKWSFNFRSWYAVAFLHSTLYLSFFHPTSSVSAYLWFKKKEWKHIFEAAQLRGKKLFAVCRVVKLRIAWLLM